MRRIVPGTPTQRLKHTLLGRLRLAALAGPSRPHTRPSPSGALPLLRELTEQLLTYRSPSPTEAAPKLHSFCTSPGWSPAATTFRSPDVPSPLPRARSNHGGRSELRRSSVDLPRVSARRGLPRADVTSTMPQAHRLPPPECRVPAPMRSSDRAGRPATFASGDAFTTPRHAGVSSAPRAGSSQPAAIRLTPTLTPTRERVAAHSEAQTNDRSGPPAVLSRGRSHAATVHV